MTKWITGAIHCAILAGFAYFKMLDQPLQPWSRIGLGVTEMLSPFAFIDLIATLYRGSKTKT